MAGETAPAKLEETGEAIEAGNAGCSNITKLMGEFAKQISEDTEIPSDM